MFIHVECCYTRGGGLCYSCFILHRLLYCLLGTNILVSCFFLWYKLFPNLFLYSVFSICCILSETTIRVAKQMPRWFFFYISEIEYRGFHVRKKSKLTLLVPFYMYSIPIPGWTCIIRKWHHYIWYTCTSWFTYIDKKDSFLMG